MGIWAWLWVKWGHAWSKDVGKWGWLWLMPMNST